MTYYYLSYFRTFIAPSTEFWTVKRYNYVTRTMQSVTYYPSDRNVDTNGSFDFFEFYEEQSNPNNYTVADGIAIDMYEDGGQSYKVLTQVEDGIANIETVDLTEDLANSVTFTKQDVSTNGGSDGSVAFSSQYKISSISWVQNSLPQSATGAVATGLSANTYTFTIYIWSVSTTKEVTINEPADFSVSGLVTNNLCHGASNGAITLSISGGTAPFTYLWSDGDTNKDRSGLKAGVYSVTVTDDTDNEKTIVFQLVDPPILELQIRRESNELIASVTGGTQPYGYTWNTGETTSRITIDTQVTEYTLIVTDGNGCQITGSFTIEQAKFYFSRNPLPWQVQTDPTGKLDLQFQLDLYVETEYLTNQYEKIITLIQPADSDGSSVFDLSRLVDRYIEAQPPSLEQTEVNREDQNFLRFYVEQRERYGTPTVEGVITKSTVFYVLQGGGSFEAVAAQRFQDYINSTDRFFTWDINPRKTTPTTPQWLYYMSKSKSGFEVHVELFYTDGSSSTQKVLSQGNTRVFELHSIPSGYQQLNIDTLIQSGKTLKAYEVLVKNTQGITVSERYRYVMDNNHQQFELTMVYQNSLGGFNALRCTGKSAYKVRTQTDEIERNLNYDYKVIDGETEVVQKMGERSITFSTGYLTKAEADSLQDFMLSRKVYLIRDGELLPVTIKDSTYKVAEDDDYEFYIAGTMELPKMYHYTPSGLFNSEI
ncbi:SprB repeat-containing protein [Limibacter armeniacum]|uniref:SprB repeat-containing protein n=1 Tax=Limibacter armeniacum TaxID=466084 RepID=UPI002FE5BB71